VSKPGAYLKLDGSGAWWCDLQDSSGFGLKPQTPTPKTAQLASRAAASRKQAANRTHEAMAGKAIFSKPARLNAADL
jgi:hypothetical protein